MTIPTTNVTLSSIQTEFGGSNPISLSEYYRGGSLVPIGTASGGFGTIATSGAISVGTFRNVSNTVTVNLTIASSTSNYNIFTAAGSPASPANVTVTINSGVFVYGTSTVTPAMDTGTGWAGGSTITIINNGTIAGSSGSGGYNSAGGNPSSLNYGAKGSNGGDALRAQYAVSVTNNGVIAGGGGGGGAGSNIDTTTGGGGTPSNYGGNGKGGNGTPSFNVGGNGINLGTPSNLLTSSSSSNGSATGGTSAYTNGTNGGNSYATASAPLGFTGIASSGVGQSSGGGGGGGYGASGGLGGPVYNAKYGFPSSVGGFPGNYIIGDSNVSWAVTGTRVGRIDNSPAVRLNTGTSLVACSATTPTTVSASITFNTDGTISGSGNGSNSWTFTDNWYHPTTASIGNSYWIRATFTTGGGGTLTLTTPTTSAGSGTWLPLSSARTWGNTISTVTRVGSQILFEIASDAAGTTIVASGTYLIKVYRSA